MKDIIWKPSKKILDESNIARFMKHHHLSSYQDLWKKSVQDIAWFWDAVMKDLQFDWTQPYQKVLDMSEGFPWSKWFSGGHINITHNCVDRHTQSDRASSLAIRWEGEDGTLRTLTYQELSALTNQMANALKNAGIGKGDVVGLTLPMLPETAATMFACFKLGAIALPIFSGFGHKALAFRLNSTQAKVLVTVDVTYRRGKAVDIHTLVTQALKDVPTVKTVIWVDRDKSTQAKLIAGRDVRWEKGVLTQSTECETVDTEAEDKCLVIYTSGTTGKPKGTVHTHAGCLAQMGKELRYAFDVNAGDVFYWFTDIGWMMGPWEIIGALAHGATVLLTEGAPDYPNPDRLWDIIDRHKVRTHGISPTAIRLLKKYGHEHPDRFAMSDLEILGSTGEVWDPESYMWFFEHVGKKRCPVINISGGTEIVGCLLSPLPVMPLKPCSLGGPALGMDVDIFGDDGKPVKEGIGHLVCKQPGPSMTKGFWGEPDRYLQTYFSKFKDVWYHGDWASRDEDGFWYLHGRSDDTIMVAGKRVGPSEFESALMHHAAVAEAAAIGIPDKLKGEVVVCFVVLKQNQTWSDELKESLNQLIVHDLGKSLAPKAIYQVPSIPKTRSAKIVRALIRHAYLGEPLGDLTSVENPDALKAFSTLSS